MERQVIDNIAADYIRAVLWAYISFVIVVGLFWLWLRRR